MKNVPHFFPFENWVNKHPATSKRAQQVASRLFFSLMIGIVACFGSPLLAQNTNDTLPVRISTVDRAGITDLTQARIKTAANDFAASLVPVFNGILDLEVYDEIFYPKNLYQDPNFFANQVADRFRNIPPIALQAPELRSGNTIVGQAKIWVMREYSAEGTKMQVRFLVRLPRISFFSETEQAKIEAELVKLGEAAASGKVGGTAVADGIDAMRLMIYKLNETDTKEVRASELIDCDVIKTGFFILPSGALVTYNGPKKLIPAYTTYENDPNGFPRGCLTSFKLDEVQYVSVYTIHSKEFLGFMTYADYEGIKKPTTLPSGGTLGQSIVIYPSTEDFKKKSFKGFTEISGSDIEVTIPLIGGGAVQTYKFKFTPLSKTGIYGRIVKKIIPDNLFVPCDFCSQYANSPGKRYYDSEKDDANTPDALQKLCDRARAFNLLAGKVATKADFNEAYWSDFMAEVYQGSLDELGVSISHEEYVAALYAFANWYESVKDTLSTSDQKDILVLSLVSLPSAALDRINCDTRKRLVRILLSNPPGKQFAGGATFRAAFLKLLLSSLAPEKATCVMDVLKANCGLWKNLFSEEGLGEDLTEYAQVITVFSKVYFNWWNSLKSEERVALHSKHVFRPGKYLGCSPPNDKVKFSATLSNCLMNVDVKIPVVETFIIVTGGIAKYTCHDTLISEVRNLNIFQTIEIIPTSDHPTLEFLKRGKSVILPAFVLKFLADQQLYEEIKSKEYQTRFWLNAIAIAASAGFYSYVGVGAELTLQAEMVEKVTLAIGIIAAVSDITAATIEQDIDLLFPNPADSEKKKEFLATLRQVNNLLMVTDIGINGGQLLITGIRKLGKLTIDISLVKDAPATTIAALRRLTMYVKNIHDVFLLAFEAKLILVDDFVTLLYISAKGNTNLNAFDLAAIPALTEAFLKIGLDPNALQGSFFFIVSTLKGSNPLAILKNLLLLVQKLGRSDLNLLKQIFNDCRANDKFLLYLSKLSPSELENAIEKYRRFQDMPLDARTNPDYWDLVEMLETTPRNPNASTLWEHMLSDGTIRVHGPNSNKHPINNTLKDIKGCHHVEGISEFNHVDFYTIRVPPLLDANNNPLLDLPIPVDPPNSRGHQTAIKKGSITPSGVDTDVNSYRAEIYVWADVEIPADPTAIPPRPISTMKGWVKKVGNPSDMFPDKWTKDKVIKEIAYARLNMTTGSWVPPGPGFTSSNTWEGYASNGMKIHMFIGNAIPTRPTALPSLSETVKSAYPQP